MEGFLEANRVVEVSLSKLNNIHRSGDLPLRKTLLISKVLNRAQDIATSAHLTFLDGPSTPRSSSKLLASISKKAEDTSESDCLPSGLISRPARQQQRQQSPIVSCSIARSEDEEPMDFENVSSVLSDILNDGPAAVEAENPCSEKATESRAPSHKNEEVSSPKRSKQLGDISNTMEWSSWRFDFSTDLKNHTTQVQWSSETSSSSLSPPSSPGKRHHYEAFPFDKENSSLFDGLEDSKRFKPSPPEGCPLESLPGFCGYLSPKNLQSAPLITYMFGNGFTLPSDPTSSDWPACFSQQLELELTDRMNESFLENHFPSSIQTSPVKFNPILAF